MNRKVNKRKFFTFYFGKVGVMTSQLSCRRCRTTFSDSNEREKHIEFEHRKEISVSFVNGMNCIELICKLTELNSYTESDDQKIIYFNVRNV